MKSWKAWLLVAVIFATGVLAGAFGMRSYMARHLPEMLASTRQSMEERILEHIDWEVGLTETQKARILPILKDSLAKGEKLREAARPQMEAIMGEMDDAIAKELDAGQQAKFAELRARMEQLRRNGPPGPPPGGPMGGGPMGPPPGPHPGPTPPGQQPGALPPGPPPGK